MEPLREYLALGTAPVRDGGTCEMGGWEAKCNGIPLNLPRDRRSEVVKKAVYKYFEARMELE